jgi:hypothetical protein
MRRAAAFAARTIRAMKLLARDTRIPRPLRWIAGLALLPIPGPVDEVILILIAPILFMFHREPMREAWQRADQARLPPIAGPGGADDLHPPGVESV